MKNINRSIKLLVLSVFLVFSLVNVSASTDGVVDGDFELGGNAWNQRARSSIADGVSYGTGSKSGVIGPEAVQNGMANGYIGQIISVEPNTDYRISAYTKVDVDGALAMFTGRWNNDQGGIISGLNGGSVEQRVSSTDWQKVSYEFNSGNNTKVLIQLVKWSEEELTKNSSAYIDNVSIDVINEAVPETYTEIWRDDFDQDVLNSQDWGYELGNIRGTEHQHYVNDEENVFLRDGKLVLRATDRAIEDQYDHPRNESRKVIYDSGSVRTHGKREFMYGKLEISAKLPKGQAVFPAFWTLGADFNLDGKINGAQGRGWPATGEIDIMELIGSNVDGSLNNRTVYQTIHYGPEENDVGRFSGNGTNFAIPTGNFNDEFHTFGFEWDEYTMKWFVDGKVVRSVPYAEDDMAKAIFNKPQYIQLNLAMGGAWPGVVGEGLAGTEFIIDSVTYSQTDAQKEASDAYYQKAPKIEGVTKLEMTRGSLFNPLSDVTQTEGYDIDFSIEDSPMFQHVGGNVNVRLVVDSKENLQEITKLPSGTYIVHYTAAPRGVDLQVDLGALTARTSTELVIKDNEIPLDYVFDGGIGELLSTASLPEGWNWVDGTQVIEENKEYEAYYKDINEGERQFIVARIAALDYEEINELVIQSEKLILDELYTQKTRNELTQTLKEVKEATTLVKTQKEIQELTERLNQSILKLQEVVPEETPNPGETPGTDEKPGTDETPGTEETPNPGETPETPGEENKVEKDENNKSESEKVEVDSQDKLPATGISNSLLSFQTGLIALVLGLFLILKSKKKEI